MALAQPIAPDLGSAFRYTLLGANDIPVAGTVTCTTSTINGDIGTTFTSITDTGCIIEGEIDAPVDGQVVSDFISAYTATDSQNPTCTGSIPTVSTTLPPGIYCSEAETTIAAGVTFILDGTAAEVWIFKIGTGGGGALTASGFELVMSSGADACNVYWWTADGATLTDSIFKGTILSGDAFTMTRGSIEGRALATRDATVTDVQTMDFSGCAAPATITVNKDFSDNNPDPVSVELICTSGSVEESPLLASQTAPAVFTISGADPDANCTATEQVPEGYTADETDCIDVQLDGSCILVNTRIPATITVNKDFSDNNPDPVSVELICTSGSVEESPLLASQTAPAVFTISGADPDASCTAIEQVPEGYTADQSDCEAVPLDDSCTLLNTRIPATITVNKDFSDNNPDQVLVELICTLGTVVESPLQASQAEPALFTVIDADPDANCTATEQVPEGYTADQSDCEAVGLDGSCTLLNTRIPATITVNKDFSDNNPDPVLVELICTSGTVVESPLQASQAEPALFTVIDADPDASCTAIEQVPKGYTADQSDCEAVPLDNSCTLLNTRIPATITVNKDFSDNNPDPVSVELICTSGSVEESPLLASQTAPAVFTISGADPDTTCTATEAVPEGYTADEIDCVDVQLDDSCTLLNTLIVSPEENTVTVNKVFSDNNPNAVLVDLACSSGMVRTTPLTAAEDSPAVFLVSGGDQGATCTATEQVPEGYTANQSNCEAVAVGGECTIFNTIIATPPVAVPAISGLSMITLAILLTIFGFAAIPRRPE